tara:strand:+ start:730 stop:1659 length:930 start_codon:yes stop_codon:yes gene_type:complete
MNILNKNYLIPIMFLIIPVILTLLIFIEQNILSHGSYMHELQDSDKWYAKDLVLKNKSWEEVKHEIELFKGTINVINENFSNDTYDKNALHILLMQSYKKAIVFNHYFSSTESHPDTKEYKNTIKDIEKTLKNLMEYNNNMKETNYTTNFSNLISIIYLPLAVITGYFGMNFASMGIHSKKDPGILNESRGQLFVFIISTIVVIIFIYITSEINKPYGAFDYMFKDNKKFTLYNYIFGSKDKPNIEETDFISKNELLNTDENKYESKYNLKNPPPSLNIYNNNADSLAAPIIRKDELGPFDNTLFEYKL